MRDFDRAIERNREALKRILVLLVALAGLAERSAFLPGPVRLLVLRILSRAEAAGRVFVFGMAHDLGVPTRQAREIAGLTAVQTADTRATRIARSFRALALLLDDMLVLAGRFARWSKRYDASNELPRVRPLRMAGRLFQTVPELPAHDTS